MYSWSVIGNRKSGYRLTLDWREEVKEGYTIHSILLK